MKRSKRGPLREFLLGRTSLFELFIVAILVSFGINIIGGSLLFLDNYKPAFGIILGIIILLLSLVYLSVKSIKAMNRREKISGFIVYDETEDKILNVYRYELAESLCRNIKALFTENPALKHIWSLDKLKTNNCKESKSVKILNELLEYFVLEQLSIHLTDYFNKELFNENELYTFKREEIPDVLLSNRVLELFSKPMEDRPMFIDEINETNTTIGEIVSYCSDSGASYQKFDLVLPRKSKISRGDNNSLQIQTNRFKMDITINFDGRHTFIAPGFITHYLDEDIFNISTFNVDIMVNVKLNFKSLFTIKGWEYYKWLDTFMNELEESISQRSFLNTIDWESNLTLIHCSQIGMDKEKW